MTQKEKLFREYASINNEIVEMFNETECPLNIYKIDIEKNILRREHTEYSVIELKDKIEWINRMKADALSKIKLEQFFKTEKGISIKNRLEYEKEQYTGLIDDCFDDFKFSLDKIIKEICGEKFIITSFGNSSFEVYYTDENGKQIFGHDFSVYLDSFDRTPSINYPCLGSFNPFESPNRVAYLEGLAKFAKPENFDKVINWFNEFQTELKKYRNKLREINNLLKNPYELAA